MGVGEPKSLCSSVGSVLLLFLHLSCIFLPDASASRPLQPRRKRTKKKKSKKKKISPLIYQPKPPASVLSEPREAVPPSCLRSFIRNLVCCFFGPETLPQQRRRPPDEVTAPPRQRQQFRHHLVFPEEASDDSKATASSRLAQKSDELARAASVNFSSFSCRDDAFPCASCGEVFPGSYLLDQHQTARHALTELGNGDSGLNIVRIIFQSGWKGRGRGSARFPDGGAGPVVHRVLKIHSSPRMLARFEECRDSVRARAAARWAAGCGESADERCMADGNERLRFYCATFLCGLAQEGNLGVCDSPFCSACGIVRRGFSDKDADGVATHETGWGSHSALPEELQRELAAMQVRRAMLLCRVVAGRVAGGEGDGSGDQLAGYDSVVVGSSGRAAEDLLVVFDARAVLPCFVIIYSV